MVEVGMITKVRVISLWNERKNEQANKTES